MAGFFLDDNRVSWASLKSLITTKALRLQCHETATICRLFVTEYNNVYWTEIWKDGATLPIGVDANQNTTDRTDYMNNFASTVNAALVNKVSLEDGAVVTAIPAAVPEDLTQVVRGFCENGGSADLRVNGGTPVVFTFNADGSDDIKLTELRFLMVAGRLDFDGVSFARSSALTNGLLVQVTSGGVTTQLANIKVNEDCIMLPARTPSVPYQGSVNDVLPFSYDLGDRISLVGGSADKVSVTVRDNLTSPAYQLHYLRCAVYGNKVV